MPKRTAPVVLALLTLASSCDPLPHPAATLYVDSKVTTPGDGSECSPFQSFPAAIRIAGNVAVSIIAIAKGGAGAIVDTAIFIETDITVEGEGAEITVIASISVSQTGILRLFGLVVKQEGADLPLFTNLQGAISVQKVNFVDGSRSIFEVINGSLTVTNCSSEGQGRIFTVIRSPKAYIEVRNSVFRGGVDLVEVNSLGKDGEGAILLSNLTVSNLSGNVINLREGYSGRMELYVEKSDLIGGGGGVVVGNVANSSVFMSYLSGVEINQILVGKVTNSTINVENCHFLNTNNRLFDLTSLFGSLLISNSTISGVDRGPIILLSANPSAQSTSLISISNSLITNVTNLQRNGLCIVFVGISAIFHLKNTEITDSKILEGGIFSITGGSAQLENVLYRDCVSVSFSFYEAKASAIQLKDVAMRSISSDVIVFSSCLIGSECRWTNVSITNSSDPNVPRARSFVLLWAGYYGFATVTESYFHNPGFSEPCMAATEHGRLYVYNSTFVELSHNNAFAANSEGFMLHKNVTFVRPRVNMLFWCTYASNCYNLSEVKIVGEAVVPLVLVTIGGKSIVENSIFTNTSDSIFRVTNAILTVRNVTAVNLAGCICRTCLSSQITMEGVLVENMVTPLLLQFTYSAVNLFMISVKNVTCEQFLSLDQSQAMITGGDFRDMGMNSFGGLISTSSSSIIIINSLFADLHCTLSIHTGLIYLENSAINIENSQFFRFNSTLIYSIQSPIQISTTKFADGGLYSSSTPKAVLTYGGVLRCDSPGYVHLTNSQFVNILADDGGVIYITGTGSDSCYVDTCTAEQNHARRRGGFLYANRVIVTITNSSLMHNSAAQGGALWTAGKDWELLTRVRSSRLYNNSAVRDGGGLMYLRSQYDVSDSVWENNTAEYGGNFASERVALAVLDKSSLAPIGKNTVEAVSGQLYSTPVLIGCLDELGQITATDNSSKLTLYTPETDITISVSALLEAKRGIFSIPSMMIVGRPGSNFTVFGELTGSITTQLFNVTLRECVPGEYFNTNQCEQCTHNTYSFDSSQPCKLCPQSADCPGGCQMSVHPGFWRPGNMTDEIYSCLVPEICAGGSDSECAKGQTGTLCSECRENFYKVSQIQCISCSSSATSVSKGVLSLLFSAVIVGYSSHFSLSGAMVYLTVIDFLQSLRISVNYNLYWPTSLAYIYSVAGDLGSVGLTAFTDSCLHAFSSFESTYSELIFAVLYAFLLVIVAPGILLIVSLLIKCIKIGKVVFISLHFSYILAPMLFMRMMQLLPCIRISKQQTLIYNSSIECWAAPHQRFSLILGLPVFAALLGIPLFLAIATVLNFRKVQNIAPAWQVFTLCLFMLRKYALICVLLFSNALQLCTQAGIVILINIGTETVMYGLNGCPRGFFFGLYQSTLAASVLQAFVCSIYSAGKSRTDKGEFAFIAANCVCIVIPAAFSALQYAQQRRKGAENVAPSLPDIGRVAGGERDMGEGGRVYGERSISENYHKVPNVSIAGSEEDIQFRNTNFIST